LFSKGFLAKPVFEQCEYGQGKNAVFRQKTGPAAPFTYVEVLLHMSILYSFRYAAVRRRLLQHLLLGLFLYAAGYRPALALDPSLRLKDYNHAIWTGKEGAPSVITTMAQTTDGWLWLGTASGLYRFDGVRFSKFVSADGSTMLGTAISNLYAKENGDLLIGYITGGLSLLRKDRLTHLAAANDPLVPASYQAEIDIDGSLWLATTRGLARYHEGKWAAVGAEHGFPGPYADSIVLDHYGRLWVSNSKKLYLLDRRQGRFVAQGIPDAAEAVVPSPDGRVWRGRRGRWQVLPLPPGMPLAPVKAWRSPSANSGGMFDRDGNHWALRCPVGICRTPPARLRTLDQFDAAELSTDRYDQAWQVSSLTPNVVLEDREGNIWVATQAGLERYRHNKLVAIDVPAGESAFQIVSDEQGRALVATAPKAYLFEAGASEFGQPLGGLHIARALDGALLRGDSHGITCTKDGRARTTPLPVGKDGKPLGNARALVAAHCEDIWAVFGGHGMFRSIHGNWTPAAAYGLPRDITSAVMGPGQSLWIGDREGRLGMLSAGKLSTIRPDADNALGPIMFIDASHGVVLAGEEALAVLDHGTIRRLHGKDPELFAGINGLVVTANGDRWFNGRKGAVHVTAAAWARALASPGEPLVAEVLDQLDGYPGAGLGRKFYSTATQTKDGRIWFVSGNGIAYVDPEQSYRNPVPPPLVIAPLTMPGARPGADGSTTLPAGTSSLRLDYAALSYTKPERVTFRYQLEGVDDGWQDAGTRRSAFYTRLGPGAYRFRVLATNEEGLSSQSEATLRFTIRPTFVQSRWFLLLCAVGLLTVLMSAYLWRTRRLARRYNERLRERLRERERIARALHDTLLQSMQGLILRFQGVLKQLPPDGETRRQIEDILDQADTAMSEGRNELMNLRTRPADDADLTHALSRFGRSLQQSFGPQFRMVVTGEARAVNALAWQEVYCIGREALFNAYRHAFATRIEIELVYGYDQLALFIRDDGAGMAGDIQRDGRREGHWGLAGMRERAMTLNGTLDLRSRPQTGTQVVLQVPAAHAYVMPARFNLWRRLQAMLGKTGRPASPEGS
jgi:signal transduction histidine kinase/ligand-binding sensor domain-containing protein